MSYCAAGGANMSDPRQSAPFASSSGSYCCRNGLVDALRVTASPADVPGMAVRGVLGLDVDGSAGARSMDDTDDVWRMVSAGE